MCIMFVFTPPSCLEHVLVNCMFKMSIKVCGLISEKCDFNLMFQSAEAQSTFTLIIELEGWQQNGVNVCKAHVLHVACW